MNNFSLGQFVRDCIFPSERNEMVPLLLSFPAFGLYLALALGILLSPAYIRLSDLASLTGPTTFNSQKVISLVNQSRTDSGLGTLTENSTLDKAAGEKANDMFANQYFAHTSPLGKTPWEFIKGAGYKYQAAGENLASDFSSAEDAMTALINSPSHRANILNPLYTEVGVAVIQGTFEGHDDIFIVQYFGKPWVATQIVAKKTTTTPTPTPKPVPIVKNPVSVPKTSPIAVSASPSPAPKPRISLEPTVLGTNTGIQKILPGYIEAKAAAIIALLTILLAIGFLITRTGAFPHHLAFRVILLIALFGYALFGTEPKVDARITPSSASTTSIVTQ